MKPLIQINDEVREMTDEEYEELLATGWTLDGNTPPEGGQQPQVSAISLTVGDQESAPAPHAQPTPTKGR